MSKDSVPQGLKFSQLYTDRSTTLQDSQRARRRVSALIDSDDPSNKLSLLYALNREIGAELINIGSFGSFFKRASIVDFLDSITVLHRSTRETFRVSIKRIFEEENLGYSIDDKGGVHLKIDKEFSRNATSAIAALDTPRFRASAAAFQHAQQSLDQVPPDLKTAMRSTFEAVEILFKLMVVKGVQRIGTAELRQNLPPIIEKVYSGNDAARRTAGKMAASLAEWVEGVHFYRHGQKEEEPTPPPLGLAVLTVSQGAAYLRWLAELDVLAGSNA